MKIRINILVKHFILLSIITQVGFASTVTLKNILRSSDKHNALSRSLAQHALAQEEKNLADTSSDPFELYGAGAIARPELGNDGYEYAVGISRNIKLGSIQAQEQRMTRLSNEAGALESQSSIIQFRNGLKNLYHQYCLDMQNYASFQQSYTDLVKLYKKKRKAYRYQEIAKSELLQIESEKRRTFAKLQEMKMMQNIKKNKILMLSKIRSSKKTKLSCRDMYPIRTSVKLGKIFRLSKSAYKKRLESTKERMKRYSHAIESVNLSAQYGKELDIDRYTIGVSLPLNFTSSRSEHERAAAMYRHSALLQGYKQSMREKKGMLQELKAELRNHAITAKSIFSNYINYKKRVLPLIKKSYDLGETSVIEYLLNRQKLYSLNQEVYASKKAYYQTLFTLYTLVEKKD